MRNLTIKRRKIFTGCLAKVKLYIEDPLNQDLTIDSTPCRFLGVLKNGDEQTFEIGDEARKIYVIADKLSKEYCNEFYQLPEGAEDVTLSGEIKMALGSSMFRFDDNNSEGIRAKRKKGAVIGVVVLIVASVLGFVAGKVIVGGLLNNRTAAPKEFTSHGMTITLTKDFKEDSMMGQTVCFNSKDVYVTAVRDPFTVMDGLEKATLEDYGNLVLEINELDNVELKSFDGIPGYDNDYTDDNGDAYHVRAFLYKTDDAFWLVQFLTFEDAFSRYESRINSWAGSVTFGG